MNVANLETASIGWPITRLGVSFFPVYLSANNVPEIETGAAAELVVDELDKPSVQALHVRNPDDKPLLIVEGEHILGGKQNRAINVTILVPPKAILEIPVSCLERGRWGERRASRRDEAFAPVRVRAAKEVGVTRSMLRSGSRDGDQTAVWREIDEMLSRASVQSPTASAADMRRAAHRTESSRAATIEKLAARGPLPGQCGIVFVHGYWVTAMDVFGSPRLLAAHWAALIRSHLLESPVTNGSPSATRALQIVRRFAWAHAKEAPGIGLGVEHRVVDDRLTGHALTLDKALVHAAFFTEIPQ